MQDQLSRSALRRHGQTLQGFPLAALLFRLRILCNLAITALVLVPAANPQAVALEEDWPVTALRQLSLKYLSEEPPKDLGLEESGQWIGRLFVELGRRLEAADGTAVPAEDVALASWLYARGGSATSRLAKPSKSAPALQPPVSDEVRTDMPPDGNLALSDLNKGDEGFRQGVEGLADRPIGERLAMTGDVTTGLQAATVPSNANLTSAFGRARMNFLLEALPQSPGGKLSNGYFFVQLRSAGGPFDTSAVDGPALFTPLNDIASDRSRFNEGTSRGNLYLGKAFYQQSLRVRDGEVRGRAGIVNLTDFFDTNVFANNEARQFLNGAFTNGAAFSTGISAPGLMVEYDRSPWLLDAAWIDKMTVRAGYALSRTERAFSSPLWAGELELATTVRGRRGHWRFGGTAGTVAEAGGVGTFHVSVDQWLTDRIGVFGRFGSSSSGAGALRFGPVDRAYSGGLQWRFTDREERVSAWSIGFSHAFPQSGVEAQSSEKVLETYYRWQITKNAALTPSFQIISGSGGRSLSGFQTVYGVRLFFGY